MLGTVLSLCLALADTGRPQHRRLPTGSSADPVDEPATPVPRPDAPDYETADERAAGVQARLSFEMFTRLWMKKLMAAERFQKNERLTVTETADGVVAEYAGYLPDRDTTVKATTSAVTPFIGILRYYRTTMRSVGKTKRQAVRGPFEQADKNRVSEIFRYTKGEWVY